MDKAALRREIEAREWYHTIDVGHDLVTAGWFDTRKATAMVGFPDDLTGKRCLDVGTYDGFWAFEMERRGASEVLAIDIIDPYQWDWPSNTKKETIDAIAKMKGRGDAFEIARSALDSKVTRLERNVYDLDEAEVGVFDFVYVGSILLHLRDPIHAVNKLRSVCAGSALFVDAVDYEFSLVHRRRAAVSFDGDGRPWWWKPNAAALGRYLRSGSFEIVQGPTQFFMPRGKGQPMKRPPLKLLRTAQGREMWLTWRFGDPHAAVHARPV
jgi:tRNA (mo5U34)-methyltransferase